MKSSTFGLGLNLIEVRIENQFLCKETKNSSSGQESSLDFSKETHLSLGPG